VGNAHLFMRPMETEAARLINLCTRIKSDWTDFDGFNSGARFIPLVYLLLSVTSVSSVCNAFFWSSPIRNKLKIGFTQRRDDATFEDQN
jgi:hypothetical protein